MRIKKMRLLLLSGFLSLSIGVWAQVKEVHGTVTDSDGFPVVDAYVHVEGSEQGVYTNSDGTYTLQANQGDSIVVEYIGFDTETLTVGAKDTYNVSLAQGGSVDLGTTVATALGIERDKKTLGYGVSNIDGDDLKKSGDPNIIQGLAGKVSGVQVTGSAGTPGAGSRE